MKTEMKTLFALLVVAGSVAAEEPASPLSDRAESLRVRLGWILPEQSTNVVTTLPELPAGTNLLTGDVFAWQTERFGTRSDVLSLDFPNPDHGFIIREFSAQGGNDDSTISRELHCLKGTIQVHLFTSVPGTNIVTVAHAIDDFIVGPEPD